MKIWAIVFLTIVPLFPSWVESQEIDFVSYLRLDNPPDYADYVPVDPLDISIERWDYTNEVVFNQRTVISVERLSGAIEPTDAFNINYFQYDDQLLKIAGIWLVLELNDLVLPVTLNLNPSLEFPRFYSLGDSVNKSGKSKVQLGILPVDVAFSITYNFLSFETVTTPLGTFENCVKVTSIKAASLPGLSEELDTTEWYHPAVGLVKLLDNEDQSVIHIQSIVEQPSTQIESWMMF